MNYSCNPHEPPQVLGQALAAASQTVESRWVFFGGGLWALGVDPETHMGKLHSFMVTPQTWWVDTLWFFQIAMEHDHVS